MDSHLTLPLLSGPSTAAINAVAGGSNRIEESTNPIAKLKKKSQGRRKIAIKKIENKNKKHVTFSKRRKGLFTKASELCILCGASVAIITFSEAGKVFSFGHPSADAVIHRYLYGSPPPEAILQNQAGDDNDDDRRLGIWWNRSIDELGLEELESFGGLLKKLKSNVESKLVNLNNRQESSDLKPVGFVGALPWDEFGDHQFHDEYLQQQEEYGGGGGGGGGGGYRGFTWPDDESISSIIPMPI